MIFREDIKLKCKSKDKLIKLINSPFQLPERKHLNWSKPDCDTLVEIVSFLNRGLLCWLVLTEVFQSEIFSCQRTRTRVSDSSIPWINSSSKLPEGNHLNWLKPDCEQRLAMLASSYRSLPKWDLFLWGNKSGRAPIMLRHPSITFVHSFYLQSSRNIARWYFDP